MIQFKLKLISSAEMITFSQCKIAINLIWKNHQAKQKIIKCKIMKYNNHKLNHLFIETIFNLQLNTSKSNILSFFNYNKMNWKLLNKKIKIYLFNLKNFKLNKFTVKKINKLMKKMMQVIIKTIEKIIFRKKSCLFNKK